MTPEAPAIERQGELQAMLAPIASELEEYRTILAEFAQAEPVSIPWRPELRGEKKEPSVVPRIDYELGRRFSPSFRKLLETVEVELADEASAGQLSAETEELVVAFGKVPEERRRHVTVFGHNGYYWGGGFTPFEKPVSPPEFPIEPHMTAFYGALDRMAVEGNGPARGFVRHFVEELVSENRRLQAVLEGKEEELR